VTAATSSESQPRRWCLRSARAPGPGWTVAGVASFRAPTIRTRAGLAPLAGRVTRGGDTVPARWCG